MSLKKENRLIAYTHAQAVQTTGSTPADVLAESPRIVFITLGGNDLRKGVSADEAFANLTAIIERVHAVGALVVLGGIDIPFWDRGFAQRL